MNFLGKIFQKIVHLSVLAKMEITTLEIGYRFTVCESSMYKNRSHHEM